MEEFKGEEGLGRGVMMGGVSSRVEGSPFVIVLLAIMSELLLVEGLQDLGEEEGFLACHLWLETLVKPSWLVFSEIEEYFAG